jgi:hypothetical protein
MQKPLTMQQPSEVSTSETFYLLRPLVIPAILCAGSFLSFAMDVFQRWAHLVAQALWEAYRIRFQYSHDTAFVAETLMLIDDSEEEEDSCFQCFHNCGGPH